jgi:hypothetical protein
MPRGTSFEKGRAIALGLLLGACAGEIPGTETPGAQEPPPGTGGPNTGKPGSPGPNTGTPGGMTGTTTPPVAGCRPPPVRVWRLTPDQLSATARSLWSDAPQIGKRLEAFTPKTERFSNEAVLLQGSSPYFGELLSVATDLATEGSTRRDKLHPCLATGLDNDSCIKDFIAGFGQRAFRRPLTTDEQTAYTKFFAEEATTHGREAAVKQVLRRFFLSPYFNYRSELGTLAPGAAVVKLTPHEVAASLSFTLLDGPPDDELRRSADMGTLLQPGEVAKQAKRLLDKPETSTGLIKFISEMAHAQQAVSSERPLLKDAATILSAMPEETRRFTTEVLWKEDARLKTLLTAPFTFVNKALATHYGLTSTATDFVRVPITGDRLGLLTQGAILTSFPNLSIRANFIRDFLLCLPPLSSPDNVDTDLEAQIRAKQQQGVVVTRKMMREQHMANPQCATCHTLLDPLGHPLDMYDDTGKSRTVYEGAPVYREGAVIGTSDANGPVTGPRELIQKLASSTTVASCFVRQTYQYIHGRSPSDDDACYLKQATDRFAQSGGDIRQLVADIAGAESFFTRTPSVEKR